MGVCISGVCGCPDWIITLAIIGGGLIYALLGALIFVIVKSFKDDLDWEFIIMFICLWPLIIAVAVIGAVGYYFARLIAMPIIGADKHDLRVLEDKVEDKIDDKMNHLKYKYKPLDVKAKPKKVKAKVNPNKKAKK